MSKPRKQNPYERRRPTRLVRESYLILCEGRSTEPEYFNAFRLSTATVRALPVTSGDAMAVVLAAIKRRNAETNKGKLYDHYWVVFDKDATPDSKFNAAIALAEAEGLQVAYSNQAFELWFLLHFDYVSGSMHRNLYADRLTTLLKFPYEKKPESVKLVFKALFDKQIQAIENARRLLDEYTDRMSGNQSNPAAEEPSTTVHHLVVSLRQFL